LKVSKNNARILIVHYHLNPGGVTRIIESQVSSLLYFKKSFDLHVLAGTGNQSSRLFDSEIDIKEDRLLSYLQENEQDYLLTYSSLMELFHQQIHRETIIHVHNLNLGKNPILTLVISDLAREGYRVLNHVHDFAEDRPENFKFLNNVITGFFNRDLHEVLYPDIQNYFYAALTTYDLNRIREKGVDEKRLFHLPNPVYFNEFPGKLNKAKVKELVSRKLNLNAKKLLITYPVRAIRRKNIGEFILLSVLFEDKSNWIVTQPPLNPAELEGYMQWKNFCASHRLPVVFEAGTWITFDELMLASDLCITTSIQEGFGMTYLEPWLFDIPMMGRNIKHVTDDIVKTGVVFPLLYDVLIIHQDNSRTDFSKLTPDKQRHYIECIMRNVSLQKEVFADNPFLGKLLTSVNKNTVASNKATILDQFSIVKNAERLERIYQTFA
jgi:glycosyltransferase involved in cell wall biosynthesis